MLPEDVFSDPEQGRRYLQLTFLVGGPMGDGFMKLFGRALNSPHNVHILGHLYRTVSVGVGKAEHDRHVLLEAIATTRPLASAAETKRLLKSLLT